LLFLHLNHLARYNNENTTAISELILLHILVFVTWLPMLILRLH